MTDDLIVEKSLIEAMLGPSSSRYLGSKAIWWGRDSKYSCGIFYLKAGAEHYRLTDAAEYHWIYVVAANNSADDARQLRHPVSWFEAKDFADLLERVGDLMKGDHDGRSGN